MPKEATAVIDPDWWILVCRDGKCHGDTGEGGPTKYVSKRWAKQFEGQPEEVRSKYVPDKTYTQDDIDKVLKDAKTCGKHQVITSHDHYQGRVCSQCRKWLRNDQEVTRHFAKGKPCSKAEVHIAL